MPAMSIPAKTIALNGSVAALNTSARAYSPREYGRWSSEPTRVRLEEGRDAAVDRLDVLGRPGVVLAARRLGDPLEHLARAAHVGPVGDREHPHALLALGLRAEPLD